MPNTLGHIVIQTLASRSVFQRSDLNGIYLGCILPDLPWISQRALLYLLPMLDAATLRFYFDIQASLMFCLILSIAFAALSRNFSRTFFILSSNALLHLLLDASQIKWANGVHLFAPFDWSLQNWGFFWPDSWLNYIITALGLLLAVYHLWQKDPPEVQRRDRGRRHYLAALVFGLIYLTLPLFLLSAPEKADVHYIATLRQIDERPGKYVEFDRVFYNAENKTINSLYSPPLLVEGVQLTNNTMLSLRGNFLTNEKIIASEYRPFPSTFRNSASYLGLLLIVLFWLKKWLKMIPPKLSKKELINHA